MSLILSFDTSCNNCSVAVSDQKQVLVYIIEEEKHRQSELLLAMIAEALAKVGASYRDLSAIILTNGPGSFTGIRIGLATAYGIHMAIGIRLCAISTLLAMAQELESEKSALVALSAGRQQYYVQEFAENLSAISELQLWHELQLLNYQGKIAGNFMLSRREEVRQLSPNARQLALYAISHPQIISNKDNILPQPLYIREHDAVKRDG